MLERFKVTYCIQEGHLKDVKYLMRAKAPLAESAGKLIKLLDELIIDLNQPLLDLPQKNITELDKKLYALRDDEMVGVQSFPIYCRHLVAENYQIPKL